MNGKLWPGVLLAYAAIDLAAAIAAPLTAMMAGPGGRLTAAGWLLSALAFGIVVSASLVAIGQRLSGKCQADSRSVGGRGA